MKKIFSILMCFTILLSTLVFTQTSASAYMYGTYGDFEYEILTDGTAEIKFYTGSATNLEIPSIIDGKTVTSIGGLALGDSTFGGCESLTSVTIPNTVTSIGTCAFFDCTSLTSITIPDSVTSIGGYAFFDCTSLTSITIPDSVTYIDMYAFANCSSLTSITIGNSVTSIGDSAFGYCSALSSITIGEGVTSIGSGAFYNTAYRNDQSNWENNVLYIGEYLIDGKYEKYNNETDEYETVIEVSGSYSIKEGTKVIAGNAFYDCSSLTSITIPDSVASIGSSAFRDCTSLTSVTIPDSVTSIGSSTFYGCTSLESITIPNSVTSIGWDAFSDCTSLESITIPDSVKSIGSGAFYNTAYRNDQSNWENNVLYIGEYLIDGKYAIYNYETDEYETVIEVSGSYSIKEGTKVIADDAFNSCESLTSITIPDSLTSISYCAFGYCTSLESITIPDSVTSIDDSAFSCCTSLMSIEIPNSVTSIGEHTFYDCTSLESITIPDSVASIGDYALGYRYDYDSGVVKVQGFTITGYKGSEAEKYAKDNGFKFIDIENQTTPTTPEQPTQPSTNPVIPDPTTTTGSDDSTTTTTKTDSVHTCNPVLVEKVEPTVDTEGKQAYYKCDCGKCYEDASGLKEIKNIATWGIIPKLDPTTEESTNPTVKPTVKPTTKPTVKPAQTMSKKAKPVIKLKAAKKSLTLTLTKKVKLANGYQVKYSLKKNMKGAKTKTLKASQKTLKIKKLKSKKTYYVRVRAYTKVNGKTVYGAWSQIKKVKVK